MSDLLAGTTIKALDFTKAVTASDSTQINNPTNTTYSAGSPVVAVTFTAPTSGRVHLIVGGGLGNSAGADRIFLAPQVFETNSSGTVVLSPTVVTRGFSSLRESAAFHYGSRRTLLEGLTPGQVYYARVVHAISNGDPGGNTGDIAYRDITVAPAT